jgi:hypothetical protein
VQDGVEHGGGVVARDPPAQRLDGDQHAAAAGGVELVIAHPGEPLRGEKLAALVAGPVLYLVGHLLFELRMTRSVPRTRLVAKFVVRPGGAPRRGWLLPVRPRRGPALRAPGEAVRAGD